MTDKIFNPQAHDASKFDDMGEGTEIIQKRREKNSLKIRFPFLRPVLKTQI